MIILLFFGIMLRFILFEIIFSAFKSGIICQTYKKETNKKGGNMADIQKVITDTEEFVPTKPLLLCRGFCYAF